MDLLMVCVVAILLHSWLLNHFLKRFSDYCVVEQAPLATYVTTVPAYL